MSENVDSKNCKALLGVVWNEHNFRAKVVDII